MGGVGGEFVDSFWSWLVAKVGSAGNSGVAALAHPGLMTWYDKPDMVVRHKPCRLPLALPSPKMSSLPVWKAREDEIARNR